MSETTESNNRTNPPRPGQSKPWLRVLLLLVIFLSGAIVGTGGTLLAVRQRVLHRIHHPEEMPAIVTARLRHKLGLSDKQAEQVETVLRNRQDDIQAMRREFQPRLEGQLDQLAEEIAEVLDDEQRSQWEEHFQMLRDTWLPTVPKASPDST
ncbi:MAG: periplasmic heavy metal sensor [Planctomycetes bacterium]|nr:periplasmic heavy metal sensor [Planctomycetota bacterium]